MLIFTSENLRLKFIKPDVRKCGLALPVYFFLRDTGDTFILTMAPY